MVDRQLGETAGVVISDKLGTEDKRQVTSDK